MYWLFIAFSRYFISWISGPRLIHFQVWFKLYLIYYRLHTTGTYLKVNRVGSWLPMWLTPNNSPNSWRHSLISNGYTNLATRTMSLRETLLLNSVNSTKSVIGPLLFCEKWSIFKINRLFDLFLSAWPHYRSAALWSVHGDQLKTIYLI